MLIFWRNAKYNQVSDPFQGKYSKQAHSCFVLSQKDLIITLKQPLAWALNIAKPLLVTFL